jgi:hypothetical protein
LFFFFDNPKLELTLILKLIFIAKGLAAIVFFKISFALFSF